MTLKRELIQIVEIDIEKCQLTYGTSPCSAVLGTTGENKCFNCYFGCQDQPHFGAPAEPSGGPDRSYDQGDSLAQADFSRSDDFFFAMDLSVPSSPTGCLWELGGSSTGAYLGFTSGNIVFRVGDGGSGTPTDAAKVDVSPDDIVGKTGTLYGLVDVSANSVSLWWRPVIDNTITLLGTDTASGSFTDWAGNSVGAVGEVNGSYPTGEDGTDYNGTITDFRVFDSTDFTPTAPDNTETLRFAENVNGFDRADRIYPALNGKVSTNPAKINLGGVSNRTGPLGKRARVTVKLKDFANSDIWFDPYQSERVSGAAQSSGVGYNPLDRSTFLAKFRQRYQYYIGRPLRVLEGEVGQALSAMRTRNYVISEWKGPDADGNVTITAKDVLDLADNKKAQAPAQSSGKIGKNLTDSEIASFDLTPEGVGDDEYDASGRASIGSEIVSFTRSSDTITLTGRGLDGSTASSHSEGDLFQQCFHVEDQKLHVVARNLLRDYAGIDSTFIPFSDWGDEGNRWLAGFDLTATIAKPTGVTDLMGELAQFGVIWWWDDINQEIVMRPNRPVDLGETVPSLDDSKTFIENSLAVENMDSERLSRVVFWHGKRDATGSNSDGSNFSRASVRVDLAAETDAEYAQSQTLEIFSRWLGAGKDSVANAVANRLLKRYKDTPRRFTFSFDAKDVANVIPAEPVSITSRLLPDDTGAEVATQMQITSVEEKHAGSRLQAVAETYTFEGRYCYITENSRTDYGSATDEEKTKGTYIVDDTLTFSDGTGPYIMF